MGVLGWCVMCLIVSVSQVLVYVLTPHVLSDGNIEWCSFNVCGVRFMFRDECWMVFVLFRI